MDVDYLRASDGTGEAALATIQSPRLTGATTLDLDTRDNWPDKFVLVTGTQLPNGYIDSSDMTVMKCHLNGNDVEIDEFAPGYVDNGNTANQKALIKPTTLWADLVADTMGAVNTAIDTQIGTGGWVNLNDTLEFVSNDGNGQATYKVSGVDKTDTTSVGMKVKLPRPTAVGTQCTDLEASSSQYASKSSPTGITFSDDYSIGGWIKMESFSGVEQGIIGRGNTTGGWALRIETDGSLGIFGGNTSNFEIGKTYQSIPTGKWVHIVMTMDLSGNATTAYINGVSVSTTISTIVSTTLQSGDMVLGDQRPSGGKYFDGKLKHIFVADKVLSEAEVQEAMVSDDLTSASFSANLDAYFKLEGDFTDSSGNGNDLTAQGGAVATDVDSPFSSTEYGIITSQSFSTDTTYGVNTYEYVPPAENITAPSYSTQQQPYSENDGKSINAPYLLSSKPITQQMDTTVAASTTIDAFTTVINVPQNRTKYKLEFAGHVGNTTITNHRLYFLVDGLEANRQYVNSPSTNIGVITQKTTAYITDLTPGEHTLSLGYYSGGGTFRIYAAGSTPAYFRVYAL